METSPVTDQDNGSGTSPCSSVFLPTYQFNRLWDITSHKLNCPCQTLAGELGKMTSKCQLIPTTCGYLYCVKYQ